MSKPTLYVFAISHYCEKARFALDSLGIDYAVDHQAPGLHAQTAQKLGVAGTSLPILEVDGGAIQGSAEILDWADAHAPSGRRLTPEIDTEACREIERRLDDVAGVHTRRLFYSEALVEHSETVKPIFIKDLAGEPRSFVDEAWPLVRERMIEGMDLGREQGEESQRILEGELAWLDGLLADGRQFLVADRFTRADLTAASLLARVAGAKEHPQHRFMQLPPRMTELQRRWNDRPSLVWIRGLYTRFRNVGGGASG